MNTIQTATRRHILFRTAIVVFAVVLGCQATWILAAEFYRQPPPNFPTNVQTSEPQAIDQGAAAAAAEIGLIRGSLWAEYALSYANVLTQKEHGSTQEDEAVEQARNLADLALGFAPHSSALWLLLSGTEARFDWMNRRSSLALKMSYYTGPNEIALIPVRLALAVNSLALADSDFQQLVRHDIGTIVTRKPELKSAIVTAYRGATPTGQQFLKETLEQIDPTLLTEIQPKE